ncbi:MAG: site-specific DNA-methyltransferase [Candidatus Aminicenantes bacterium]|nr:site-specific DNA-methyltransferase [Candidatus Aminicenantes bacterium]
MTEQPDKLDLHSQDIPEEKKQELLRLFPEISTEGGKIDFERLKQAMGEMVDVGKERYGMNWPGKADCFKTIQAPSMGTLRPCPEESINFDTTENLIFEGDNLEVLKLLQKSYLGKIKMIYIDPPYNTGKEFIYPDNYTESLQTYLQYTGQVDNEGKKFSTNTEADGRFHSKWMNMMYPRLYLARNLLRDDGVIFISIDDNEVSNLRKLCDEIFGEENFVDCVIWKKRYGGGAKEKYLVTLHEYALFYAKNKEILGELFIPLDKESVDRYYKLKDENYHIRGLYRTHPLEAGKAVDDRPNLIFPIIAPDGTKIMPERQWYWNEERVKESINKGEIEFIKGKNGWTVHSKQYLKDENGEIRQAKAFSIIDDVYSQHGTNEMIDIFGNAKVFSYPKPSNLLAQIINMGTNNDSNSIILDFFSGSATTSQAVLDLNKQDNGNRKFILVQLPEPCAPDSEAFKAGYNEASGVRSQK